MEEKGMSKSCVFVSQARDDSLCAMYFGISCAFFALKNFSNQVVDNQILETRDKMLQGSANLLGLLIWKRGQIEEEKNLEKYELLRKLEAAEKEIMELRSMRSEDAKANEKVASIYAAQEQSWFAERRKLRHQIAGLLNDLRILDKRKNESISELHRKVGEMEVLIKSKEKVLEEEERRRKEFEEKLKSSEGFLEELREKSMREAQDHSNELLKHKTAFIELVSNQRQLEAELSRTLRQVEASKQHIEFLIEEREEAVLMVEELSVEIEKMRTDSEHKDKILSAMMKKIKLGSPGKQIILKNQGKLFRPKRKIDVGERKMERLGSFPSSRSERKTLRTLLSRQVSSRLLGVFPGEIGEGNALLEDRVEVFDDGWNACVRKGNEDHSSLSEQGSPEECTEIYEATRLDEWVQAEAERYHNVVEQQHQLELDSLEDQIRMKDDKLEACRWQVLSAEVESKRLLSKIKGLNQEMSQLRDNNLRLETLLVDRELELKTLKDQIAIQLSNLSSHQKTKRHSSRREILLDDHEKSQSKVKILKKKPAENRLILPEEVIKKEKERQCLSKHTSSTSFSSIEDTEEKNGVEVNVSLNKINSAPWKVDLHALGTSYKIKRLNQQFLMLDRLLTTKQENDDLKGFSDLISLLKKQLSRYQSLQEKTDDLSKHMGEKDEKLKRGISNSKKTKEETRKLEHFLEETFQLQRYIVATGQKLMEVQSKIASGFVARIANELDGPANFDMKRFGDTIQSLFKDVQRGLEVRISRIIGDLEGTLAYEGIHFLN